MRILVKAQIMGALLAVACSPATAQDSPAVRDFLQTVPTFHGEGNLGGRQPTQTEISYAFTCGGQLYRVSITMRNPLDWAGRGVALVDIEHPRAPLSPHDRLQIQEALEDFRIVHTISLRCASDRTDAVLISGFGKTSQSADGPQPDLAKLFSFDQGRLVRITE